MPETASQANDMLRFGMSDGTLRILIAEDNAQDVVLLRRILGGEDVVLKHCSTLKELIADGPAWHPDVVLLDLRLDEETDFMVVVRRVIQRFAIIPVVVWTGIDDEDAAIRTLQAGVSDFLTKNTFGGHELMRRLREAEARMQAPQKSVVAAPDDLARTIVDTLGPLLSQTLAASSGTHTADDAFNEDDAVLTPLQTIKRWWPQLSVLGTLITLLATTVWELRGMRDDIATEAEVLQVVQAHNELGHTRDAADEKRIESVESAVVELKKDRNLGQKRDKLLMLEQDYGTRLQEWSADRRRGQKPKRSPAAEALKGELLTGIGNE